MFPSGNPQETYAYFKLPVCPANHDGHQHSSTFGSVLEGSSKESLTQYQVHFRQDVSDLDLCKVVIDAEKRTQLIDAIGRDMVVQFVLDELPRDVPIGKVQTDPTKKAPDNLRYFIYLKYNIVVSYNKDHVIQFTMEGVPSSLQLLDKADSGSTELLFQYGVEWTHTDVPFEDRMSLYAQNGSRDLEVHWLSILNSIALVVLLVGFLAIVVVRILKADYIRYEKDEEGDDDIEDYGWKLLHGDVFRYPSRKAWFVAVLGNGAQFLVLFASLVLIGVLDIIDPYSASAGGQMTGAAIVLFALCSGVAGFVSSYAYRMFGGEEAMKATVLTVGLWTVPFFIVASFCNTVAWAHESTAALPFLTILYILVIWGVVGLFLTLLGAQAGKNAARPFVAPCRTRNIPREIPENPWYRQLPAQMAIGGFLPFTACYIEIYYIFHAVYSGKTYTLFGILFLVYLILLVVTASISVALTYFQLSSEDHRWWWRSMMWGGSTGIFIFMYAIYFFNFTSNMSGFVQASFFFGYVLMVCYAFFLMLASVGFVSSFYFVRRIYSSIKVD